MPLSPKVTKLPSSSTVSAASAPAPMAKTRPINSSLNISNASKVFFTKLGGWGTVVDLFGSDNVAFAT